jgi:polo-like kinase 1
MNSMNALSRGSKVGNQIGIITKNSETWVKQWVDYSSKYGLGYLLSNGSSGVFFNDSTKIVLDPTGSYLEYMERRQVD